MCIFTSIYAFILTGAFVNVKEPMYNSTPLMLACKTNNAELVKLFLYQGAEVDLQDHAG